MEQAFKKYIKNFVECQEWDELTQEELQELTDYIFNSDELFDLLDNIITSNYNFIKGTQK